MADIKTYDELKALDNNLVHQIDQAERSQDIALSLKLKKEYHYNKIAMLHAISDEDKKRKALTARELRELVASQPIPPRYGTGIVLLDDKLKGGFEVGTFIQVAGESGAGKTTLLLAILSNVAKYKKEVFFNFEMGSRRIVKRLENLLTTEEQWDNLLIDTESRHINTLCMEITLHAREGQKFFMIDSMMKIETDSADYLKGQEEISHKLSKLAQQKELIIMLINQVSEEALKNKRLSLKGSNSQKYDADMAFFLTVEGDKRVLHCAKNRQDEYLFNLELTEDDVKGKTTAVEVEYQTISQPVI